MGQPIKDLEFNTAYYPVAALSCAFFLYFFNYLSPKLSSKFFSRYNLLSHHEHVDWNNRVNSTVHAVVVSSMCVYTSLNDDEITKEPIWWDSPLVRYSCAVVTGYMVSDLVILTVHYKQIGEVFYVFHHAASIYAYYYVMTYGLLPYFANYRLVVELSTPFVNQRWFLLQLGYDKSSTIVLWNSIALAVSFFLVRIAVMPSFWIKVYYVYNTPAFNRLGYIQLAMIIPCVILDVINSYWFYRICLGAYKIFVFNQKKGNLSLHSKDTSSDFKNPTRSLVPNYTESHKRSA